MKVAIIANYWKNSSGGGVKTYLTNLVDALNKTGRVQTVVVFREGSDPENFKVSGNRFLFPVRAFLRLIKIRPDVIHSHGTWYCLMAGCLYKLFFRRARLIHTFHTQPAKEEKLPYFARLFLQTLINRCDVVTFVSESLKENIEKTWKLEFKKAEITYGGVKVKSVSEDERREFYERFIAKDRWPVLVSLGLTVLKYKAEGAKIAMLAVKFLREKYPKILLLLTRSGPYLDELKRFAEKEGIAEHVVFTGDIENPFTALEVCDIYLHITLGEGGLSMALLEAMAAGKPIVATPVGGIPEVISNGENGLLVEPDAKKIAEKIEYLLENPHIAEKLGESAKRTAEKFTWEKTAERFLELYGMKDLQSEQGLKII